MGDSRTCAVCGCVLGDGDTTCPVCGTPVSDAVSVVADKAHADAAGMPAHDAETSDVAMPVTRRPAATATRDGATGNARTGASRPPSSAQSDSPSAVRRGIPVGARIAAALGGIALIAGVALAVRAWLFDRDLHARASDAAGEAVVAGVSGGAHAVMGLEAGTPGSQQGASWLFVDGDVAYLLTAGDKAWSVGRLALGGLDADTVPTEVAHGDGRISVACLAGGRLWYVLVGDTEPLRSSDLTGGFSEYADVVGARSIAAAGDVVVAVTNSNQMLWVDAVTGVVHDITDAAVARLGHTRLADASLGVDGAWVCVATGDGTVALINVNDPDTGVSLGVTAGS